MFGEVETAFGFLIGLSWFNWVLTNALFFFSLSTDSVRNKGGRVFVHCQAGISRSATICLAYLMRTNRVKLEEAFEFVKQRRSIISPNFSFMGQLLQFESQVLASSTCSSEAGSPAISKSSTVFNFPIHTAASPLSFLKSPITTSPSCWDGLFKVVWFVFSPLDRGEFYSYDDCLWGDLSSIKAQELLVPVLPPIFHEDDGWWSLVPPDCLTLWSILDLKQTNLKHSISPLWESLLFCLKSIFLICWWVWLLIIRFMVIF